MCAHAGILGSSRSLRWQNPFPTPAQGHDKAEAKPFYRSAFEYSYCVTETQNSTLETTGPGAKRQRRPLHKLALAVTTRRVPDEAREDCNHPKSSRPQL